MKANNNECAKRKKEKRNVTGVLALSTPPTTIIRRLSEEKTFRRVVFVAPVRFHRRTDSV